LNSRASVPDKFDSQFLRVRAIHQFPLHAVDHLIEGLEREQIPLAGGVAREFGLSLLMLGFSLLLFGLHAMFFGFDSLFVGEYFRFRFFNGSLSFSPLGGEGFQHAKRGADGADQQYTAEQAAADVGQHSPFALFAGRNFRADFFAFRSLGSFVRGLAERGDFAGDGLGVSRTIVRLDCQASATKRDQFRISSAGLQPRERIGKITA